MSLTFAIAAALAGSAAPEGDGWYSYRSHDIAAAKKAGCIVQLLPAPSGKVVPQEPLIRCRRLAEISASDARAPASN